MPRVLAEGLGFSENSPGLDDGPERVVRWTGTWGDLSTQSFILRITSTMGEGGSVNIVRDQKLKVIAESFRDWGGTVGAPVASIILAVSDLPGNLVIYLRATITNTHTVI